MAKFGTFTIGSLDALSEYTGDHMESEKELVRIYKQGSIEAGTYDPTHPGGSLVAVVRLEAGQEVKRIAD
jgi:hypothetical protein